MVDERKYSKEFIEGRIRAGTSRVLQENALLQMMLDGFSTISLSSDDQDLATVIYKYCDLESYAHLTRHELDSGYGNFGENLKIYCHCLLALDALWKRGFVEKNVNAKRSGKDGELLVEPDSTIAGYLRLNNPVLTAQYLHSGSNYEKKQAVTSGKGIVEISELSLSNITYTLTAKGYEVGLKLQEHRDQESRFSQQTSLTEKAIEASNLSAQSAQASRKIAGQALFAAIFIAAGSIGNLAFQILKHYSLI